MGGLAAGADAVFDAGVLAVHAFVEVDGAAEVVAWEDGAVRGGVVVAGGVGGSGTAGADFSATRTMVN